MTETTTMKAAVLREIGKPLAVEDVPLPRLEPDEALVQTYTCGVCRTDLHIQDGLAYVPALPHIPGHEPAGVVVEVGARVREVKVGQRVVPHLFVRQAECRYSRAGHDAQACHLKGILGVTLAGGFAEYFRAPGRNLLPVPEAAPFEAAGLVACAGVTAVHALRTAGLRLDDSAAVIGVGGIGLILIQLLHAAGVWVLAVDRNPACLERAKVVGADETRKLDPPGASSAPRPGADAEDVDCVFELVGRAETMRAAADLVRRGGQIVVVGEEAEFPPLPTVEIAQRELRIVGSRNGGMQDALDALDLLARGRLRPVIAATFPLDRINEAFDFVRAGRAPGRVVIRVRS